jgi:hypothetical protein
MIIYELIIEDMTTLGAMGTSPTVKERKLFLNPNDARTYAEADYEKNIKWTALRKGSWTSGDLSYVMYVIHARTVE